jgi:hypothetical protein
MRRTGIFGRYLISVLCVSLSLGVLLNVPSNTQASRKEGDMCFAVVDGGNGVKPGVYFYQFEPSFYTGFAPRCQDPRRISTYLGRGNQLRVTVVISREMIAEYLSDLATRYEAYRELIDTGEIHLSQNTEFEKFQDVIQKENILVLAGRRGTMSEHDYWKLSLEKLQKLNNHKIFHIKIDFRRRMLEWSKQLAGLQGKELSLESSLDIINDMLPTRMRVSELSSETRGRLTRVIEAYARYEEGQHQRAWEGFYNAAADLFVSVTEGIYPIHDEGLDYYEFTAIYPVGTLNEFVRYDGAEIPLYPCPGKRKLVFHQRTHVVDHIPDKANYSYLPWIPYMHVGERLHNSFHSLWFDIDTTRCSFIPNDWRLNTKDSRTGEPFTHLWLVSRGPMSHGCTHVNAGHISELRQLLPSSEAALGEVITYRSQSHQFDVFDIDGDGQPEVMGVEYFYAYSLSNKKPSGIRAASDRASFYAWLYKKGYHYDVQDRVIFDEAPTPKFIGNKVLEGKIYTNIPLYEADYSPETIQFYKCKAIDFVRELRRVSSTYKVDRSILKINLQ